MAELKDLDVDRVDAVTEPATGQRWLICKSTDPGDMQANLAKLADAAGSALLELSKGGPYSPGVISALENLASILQFKGEFQPQKEPPPEEKPSEELPKKKPPVPPEQDTGDQLMKSEEFKSAIVAMVEKALQDGLAEFLPKPSVTVAGEQAMQKASEPVSKQVKQTEKKPDEKKKLGDGIFTNIVFGK